MPDLATVPFITPTATLRNVKQFGTVLGQHRHDAFPPGQSAGGLYHAAFRVYPVCILAPQTTHGKQLHHLFQQAVVQNGGEVIAAEWYRPGTTDAVGSDHSHQRDGFEPRWRNVAPDTRRRPIGNSPVTEEEIPEEGQEEVPLVYPPGFDACFSPDIRPTCLSCRTTRLFRRERALVGTNTWNHSNLLKWGRSSIEGGLFGDALSLQTTDPAIRRFITTYRERFQAVPPSLRSRPTTPCAWSSTTRVGPHRA